MAITYTHHFYLKTSKDKVIGCILKPLAYLKTLCIFIGSHLSTLSMMRIITIVSLIPYFNLIITLIYFRKRCFAAYFLGKVTSVNVSNVLTRSSHRTYYGFQCVKSYPSGIMRGTGGYKSDLTWEEVLFGGERCSSDVL